MNSCITMHLSIITHVGINLHGARSLLSQHMTKSSIVKVRPGIVFSDLRK